MLSEIENFSANPLKKWSKGNVTAQMWIPRWNPDLSGHVTFWSIFEGFGAEIFDFW